VASSKSPHFKSIIQVESKGRPRAPSDFYIAELIRVHLVLFWASFDRWFRRKNPLCVDGSRASNYRQNINHFPRWFMPQSLSCFALKTSVINRKRLELSYNLAKQTSRTENNVTTYRLTIWAFVRSPFAGSFLHFSQKRNSSFFYSAGFLPAKDDPGISSSLSKMKMFT